MEIAEKDFSVDFLQKFGDKEKQYIIDFCNTFQRTFPNVIDKQTLLDKISRIKAINPSRYWNLSKNVYGETYYEDYSICYLDGQDERDERNTIYHELLHVLSHKQKTPFNEVGLFREGVVVDNGNVYYEFINNNPETGKAFDEIMNEYYTILMLENEGSFLEEEHIIREPTKTQSKVTITDKGKGYTEKVFLAELYHQSFGNDLLKAKILDRTDFVSKFNSDFKDLEIKNSDNKVNRPNFSKIGIQLHENIFGAQLTAINIWRQKMNEKVQKNGLDLYEYLKLSHSVMKTLPNVHSRNKAFIGNVNNELINSHELLIFSTDEEIIMKQLRPDLVGEQTEPEKIIQKKQFISVIRTLRDNIEGLTREDIEKVSYGEISSYNHSNLSCLILNAGAKSFMTFASEEGYRGSSEFKTLPEDQTKEIFSDDGEVEYATVPTPRHIWSIIKDENGYIPLTDNPNLEYATLENEILLNGETVSKEDEGRNGPGMAQEYGINVNQEEREEVIPNERITISNIRRTREDEKIELTETKKTQERMSGNVKNSRGSADSLRNKIPEEKQ